MNGAGKAAGLGRGALGEEVALRNYLKDGYKLERQNYRTRHGEIDIVLRAPDGMLVFAEVKTRRAGGAMLPREAVDSHKQRRLILAAQAYLAVHGGDAVMARFDVVEVEMDKDGTARVNRIENAFTA